MPELPEVTTTVRGLNTVLPGRTITDVWTDLAKKTPSRKHFEDTLKSESFYKKFKKAVIGTKITRVDRRAKNILITLSNKNVILIHMKMTGHILFGTYAYNKKENSWTPASGESKALFDPFNRFIHVVFSLSNGKHFVLCDSRKFGKVTLFPTKRDADLHFTDTGPEPLDAAFTFTKFKTRLLKRPTGNIKTVLMDQAVIAGIGNIYSDEMLWMAGIHPQSHSRAVPTTELKTLFASMKKVLARGIDFGGDSTSDYRDINGKQGKFQSHHNVYRRTGEQCGKKGCKGVILRKVINGRSAHFCSVHQKLFN